MNANPIIALTGGPGGGKSTLIKELLEDQDWAKKIIALPEAISIVGPMGISLRERLFQRIMVEIQIALEEAINQALNSSYPRVILCHRGTLDPLVYWLVQAWPEDEFFNFTRTSREQHYKRYIGVLHLVTAAEGAPKYYTRWPDSHRPEAIRIDRLLGYVWQDHPQYHRFDNHEKDWETKAQEARATLTDLLSNWV